MVAYFAIFSFLYSKYLDLIYFLNYSFSGKLVKIQYHIKNGKIPPKKNPKKNFPSVLPYTSLKKKKIKILLWFYG